MFKKTITFDDFNGKTHTQDFYFHLSAAELIEMEAGREGGMEKYLLEVIKSNDGKAIVEVFTMLIRQAYGEKSEDGMRFHKSEEIWNRFYESSAYDILFMGIVTDAEEAANFANHILPQKMMKELREKQATLAASPELQARAAEAIKDIQTIHPVFRPELIQEKAEPPKRRLEDSYTTEELMNMPAEQFAELRAKHKAAKQITDEMFGNKPE